ncbi:hypothetical protein HDU98_003448, partial [Podochytrium sp. JEL0797]
AIATTVFIDTRTSLGNVTGSGHIFGSSAADNTAAVGFGAAAGALAVLMAV